MEKTGYQNYAILLASYAPPNIHPQEKFPFAKPKRLYFHTKGDGEENTKGDRAVLPPFSKPLVREFVTRRFSSKWMVEFQ